MPNWTEIVSLTLPHLWLLAGVLLVLLVEGFAPRRWNAGGWTAITVFALGAVVASWSATDGELWQGMYVWDGYARLLTTLIMVVGALVCLSSVCCEEWQRTGDRGSYYALLLLSALGFTLMCSAGSLLTLYITLEIGTVSLFALTGHRKTDPRSGEAALKLLVVSATSSAILLYGISLIYGAYGTTVYTRLPAGLLPGAGGSQMGLFGVMGMVMVLGGLAFKITAAPFHLWVADVYQGAPTPISAFLSTASKTAGFAALLRLLIVGLYGAEDVWVTLLVALSALSMVLGNLVALAQSNLKRLLAYSSVAQAGYLLVAVVSGLELGLGATLFYLLLYAFANAGAFFVAQALLGNVGSEELDALRGLRQRAPALAFSMLLFLLSLGGIPPLAGFWGKLYLFWAGASEGHYTLVFIGAVTSVVALYYYLMVAKRMFIDAPVDETPFRFPRSLSAAIALCVVATAVIGLYPRPWLEWSFASTFLTLPPEISRAEILPTQR
ncbi:MAG: NADH-quinone oxidoreductase subunit N [Armatimonadota bacterium]|nr:NADH-quinone oxidoreductase subunit N [Armatimonadota bacterium]MDW8289394.1 NADH-quinone oxidoreductase subunit N [Armatimonadota bacterium]